MCKNKKKQYKTEKKISKTVDIIDNYKTSTIVIATLNYVFVKFSLECISVDQSRELQLTRAQLAAINYNGGE